VENHNLNPEGAEPTSRPVRAAQYVRMSTEHQQYSTENQADMIREYAVKRGYEIVRTYADDGKSGLKMEGRDSLRSMIEDVQTGNANFAVILVYDVSRWGRFQDTDESAYYEYLCKRAGIDVHYCAEQFENDGGPAATIIKSVKRVMAAEYSRELSSKVFKGQCKLIELGYRQGGPAGYGLRRMLIDHTHKEKGILARREKKSLQTDRVILVRGPEEEVRVVQWIYHMFIRENRSEREIADILNGRGILTDLGRPWTRSTVREVLTNEKYIGNNVYNRRSFKLKKKRVVNTPDMWVRREGAFDPIISPEDFYTVQGIILARNQRLTDDEMLDRLRTLLAKHATLSSYVIDSAEGVPPSSAYRARFGSLLRAYQLAGYRPDRDYSFLEINRTLGRLHPQLLDDAIRQLGAAGAHVALDAGTDLLLINGEYTASMVLSRCRQTARGLLRWLVRIDRALAPDITILVRMDAANEQPADYYLLPIMDIAAPKLLLCESNGVYLDTYQFDNLNYFTIMAKRKKIEVAT
jgi:DNA invertase Pin-like site-specific DNA recombinase